MGIGQIIVGGIFLTLAIGAFVISYLQFKEKGYLFNNAYFWASPKERKQMDKNKESKKTYYRQSGFAFMFIGLAFLIFAVYIVTDWMWMYIVFWVLYRLSKLNDVNNSNSILSNRQGRTSIHRSMECIVHNVRFRAAPKPPSDEGGGTAQAVTEGETAGNRSTVNSLPQSA